SKMSATAASRLSTVRFIKTLSPGCLLEPGSIAAVRVDPGTCGWGPDAAEPRSGGWPGDSFLVLGLVLAAVAAQALDLDRRLGEVGAGGLEAARERRQRGVVVQFGGALADRAD